MIGAFTRRGQPLFALVLLLGSWVSARAVMWEPEAAPHIVLKLEVPQFAAEPPQVAAPRVWPAAGVREAASLPGETWRGDVSVMGEAEFAGMPDDLPPARSAPHRVAGPAAPHSTFAPLPPAPPQVLAPAPAPAFAPVPARTAIGHNMLWMAAMARVPMPADLAWQLDGSGRSAVAGSQLVPQSGPQPATRRWSADGWVLWRRGSTGAASGALLSPSYGASQAGAVLRYRLAPGSALRPAAYLRTTAALNGSSEREVALGLQLRPVSGLPVALAGEARLTAVPGRTYLRPAIFAVTELSPFDLLLGLRGEAYGQAGYVGGRFATGFAEGQIRVDRRLAGLGKGDVRLGGGVWGGVQKGASRVDAGPTLTIGRPLGGSGSMRLAADWRFRVAGKAAPGSGPAVTLSAGF